MTHYICTGGCAGLASEPNTCSAETCPKHGQPLTSCECADGRHNGNIVAHETEEEAK